MEYTKVYYGRSREKVKIKADDGGSLAHALIVLSSTPYLSLLFAFTTTPYQPSSSPRQPGFPSGKESQSHAAGHGPWERSSIVPDLCRRKQSLAYPMSTSEQRLSDPVAARAHDSSVHHVVSRARI